MYASLIGAGISQLYDLFKSQTSAQPNAKTSAQSSVAADVETPSSPSASSATTGTGAPAGFSTDLNKLLIDLQSGSSATSSGSNATSTVSNDLQSVFKDLGKSVGGGAGHHHGPHLDKAGAAASSGPSSNSFQNLAASLLAYSKTQGIAGVSGSGGLAMTA